MPKRWFILTFLLGLLLTACQNSDGTLAVSEAWARSNPQNTDMTALYFTIDNTSGQADVLTGVSTAISSKAELHRTQKIGDAMKMEPVPGQTLDIPSGQTVMFAPGGLHVMLLGLSAPLMAGESFQATLRFQNAGDIPVTVSVKE